MEGKKNSHLIKPILVILFHVVGIIGFSNGMLFVAFGQIVPYHLLLMGYLVFSEYNFKKPSWQIKVLLVMVLGWVIEVIGVNTGLIFGKYTYQEVLGFKVFGTPLLIGLNWALVVLGSLELFRWVGKYKFIAASMFLVLLDVIMEPVATRLGYWQWAEITIPLQNYIAWFIVALVLTYILNKEVEESKPNKTAIVFILSQVVFFSVLRII